MSTLVVLDRLTGDGVVENGVAVVHGRAHLTVGEVHVGLHLLPEVLHESVGAQIQGTPDAALPPGHGPRVGEVDQRGARVEVRDERVRSTTAVGGDVPVVDRILIQPGIVGAGVVLSHERAEVHQRMDRAGPELGDDSGQHVSRKELPPLDAITVERKAVAVDVRDVAAYFGEVVRRRVAGGLHAAVQERSRCPRGRHGLASGESGQVAHRAREVARHDAVVQTRAGAGDTPRV